MFLGEYFHSIDEKGRLVLPSAFRRRLEDGCVVTKGQDGQLSLFSVEVFEAKASDVITQPQDRAGRRFSRTVFGGADLQTLDRSGRVLLKPELRGYAGLEPSSEVAVIGVYDHIELWNRERYLRERELGDESYREDAEE